MKSRCIAGCLVILVCLACCLIVLSSCSASSSDSFVDENGIPHWSEKLEYKIKKAYAKANYGDIWDDADFYIEDVRLDYYGSYSGYEAVLLTGPCYGMSCSITVGGHTFSFNPPCIILMYKDDTLTEFQEVFNEGKITQEDIDRLYELYMKPITNNT